jgi:hypothetical protein
MATEHDLGTIGGVHLRADNTAAVASLMLWAMVHTILWWVLELPPLAALQTSLALLLLHWLSILLHHFGHAAAAHSTGYPMQALIHTGLLGRDQYPKDEPELPVRVHATRALGGPAASLLAGLGLLVAALILRPDAFTTQLVLWAITLENLILLGLGVFVPLGFTDGSTLLNLWRSGRPDGPPD